MPDPSWYQDPRWWGIIASGLAAFGSLGLQAFYRYRDHHRDRRESEFDEDIGDPLRESFPALRSLRAQVLNACSLHSDAQRHEAVKKIREESAEEAISSFSSAARFADERLDTFGYFTGIAIDFEDIFQENLAVAQNSPSFDARSSAKRSAAAGIDDLIAKSTTRLRYERKRYRPK